MSISSLLSTVAKILNPASSLKSVYSKIIYKPLIRGLRSLGQTISQIGKSLQSVGYTDTVKTISDDVTKILQFEEKRKSINNMLKTQMIRAEDMIEERLRRGSKYRVFAQVSALFEGNSEPIDKWVSFYTDENKTLAEFEADLENLIADEKYSIPYKIVSVKWEGMIHNKDFTY